MFFLDLDSSQKFSCRNSLSYTRTCIITITHLKTACIGMGMLMRFFLHPREDFYQPVPMIFVNKYL